MNNKISTQDLENLQSLRKNVELFIQRISDQYCTSDGVLLDIAPQDHQGAQPFFRDAIKVETLDIDPKSGATYIADLCNCAHIVGESRYEYIVCTEVLEHTLQPFDAVNNIFRMLKTGGLAFISTPFNFRIHGPLPDCWRFTEYGLRELFKNFEIIELVGLETQDRFLMPIQYTLIAKKTN